MNMSEFKSVIKETQELSKDIFFKNWFERAFDYTTYVTYIVDDHQICVSDSREVYIFVAIERALLELDKSFIYAVVYNDYTDEMEITISDRNARNSTKRIHDTFTNMIIKN